jgi:antitoxin ParD1/3/4
MNISLTPTLDDYIQSKVDTGLFNNRSEVIREALRMMHERDSKLETLRAAHIEGENSGDAGPINFTDINKAIDAKFSMKNLIQELDAEIS